MFQTYCKDWEVLPEFEMEFISIFKGWLGLENLHKLDEVTEQEWGKFNILLELVSEQHELHVVDYETESCSLISDVNLILESYSMSMEKDASRFTTLIIPELDCVLSEDWDYTYILWHKNKTAVKALEPLIHKAGLFHFCDEST
ncbi:MAG: hypothetical protein COA78_31845 [Blastopirellula sp.]|nr:MAG: hypothetical protein COA78_31845 [Blastopirellula sp.]